jgi:RimJ/RimL family protein N-acetyltransferase
MLAILASKYAAMPTLKPTLLTTERLTLRWLDERDTAAQFAIFSDPKVTQYWSGAPWTDMSQSETLIASTLDDYRDGCALRLGVVLARTGEMIGNVALHHFFEQNRRCELGYALASAHWGKGYALEALRAALDHGFRELDLNRVEADIDPRNAASARVLERLGFRKEGFMPERWIVHGEMADTVYYGLLKKYWDEAGSVRPLPQPVAP